MADSKTLYSLDKAGNPIQWTITWEDDWYYTTSGRCDGQLTVTEKTYCKGKNKGRANETTDAEQCDKEVQSKIDKQYKRDFHDTIPTKKRFEVTLAKEFKARRKFLKPPFAVSAKLDGFRCYITKDGMFSRQHNKIVSCPHIWESVKNMFEVTPSLVLDGELYSHELKDDFNKVASLLSRTKNLTDEFLAETRNVIKFHMFDFFDDITMKAPFNERFKLQTWTGSEKFLVPDCDNDYVVIVAQFKIDTFEQLEKILDKAIEDGFEGVMLRDPKMPYVSGRCSELVKYKRFTDSEYKIVDIQEGVGNAAGMAAIVVCQNDAGTIFSAGTGKGWDNEAKTDLFVNKDKYIGKKATIVYQELTPEEKVPRFGKLKCIREDI